MLFSNKDKMTVVFGLGVRSSFVDLTYSNLAEAFTLFDYFNNFIVVGDFLHLLVLLLALLLYTIF